MSGSDLLDCSFLSRDTPDKSKCPLNVAGVFHNSVTRDWAMQTSRRAAHLAGEDEVQSTWYDVNTLNDPKNFASAVRAALTADVIVISVYAAVELPMQLCVWVESWVPHRRAREGALTALVGVHEPLEPESLYTLEYLKRVARKARLDFFPHERKRPVVNSSTSMKSIIDGNGAETPSLADLYGWRFNAYYHWGLNE